MASRHLCSPERTRRMQERCKWATIEARNKALAYCQASLQFYYQVPLQDRLFQQPPPSRKRHHRLHAHNQCAILSNSDNPKVASANLFLVPYISKSDKVMTNLTTAFTIEATFRHHCSFIINISSFVHE